MGEGIRIKGQGVNGINLETIKKGPVVLQALLEIAAVNVLFLL